jgi:uncharacterized protein YndB with AHSA1/START domain
MSGAKFVYVTYIRATPENVWQALIGPESMHRYWFGAYGESSWNKGAPWKLMFPDGSINCRGEVLESDPPRRLVLQWFNEAFPELADEGETRCSFALEPLGDCVKLTLTHEAARVNSPTIKAVSGGWPKILASLKSLVETGAGLEIHAWTKG